MTKSKGIGRGKGGGGAQPGAGRPRKIVPTERVIVAKVEQAAKQVRAVVPSPMPADGSPAQALLEQAYATLADVMTNSPFPAPRVTAARAIIDLAKAEEMRSAGASPAAGKKVQTAASASKVASAGKFASPSAPKLVVSNP